MKGCAVMEWEAAKIAIGKIIKEGVEFSSTRRVLADNACIESGRYNIKGELGFRISISTGTHINIPWSTLEKCYKSLTTEFCYGREAFRSHFPMQLEDHSCYVHVIGEIFVRAGLAEKDGRIYRPSKECKVSGKC